MESAFNQTPQEILRSMPGVTSKNYRYIMSKVENLEELCELEVGAITDLIGAEAGKLLWSYLHKDTVEDP